MEGCPFYKDGACNCPTAQAVKETQEAAVILTRRLLGCPTRSGEAREETANTERHLWKNLAALYVLMRKLPTGTEQSNLIRNRCKLGDIANGLARPEAVSVAIEPAQCRAEGDLGECNISRIEVWGQRAKALLGLKRL